VLKKSVYFRVSFFSVGGLSRPVDGATTHASTRGGPGVETFVCEGG
jgi:hypothetical protein